MEIHFLKVVLLHIMLCLFLNKSEDAKLSLIIVITKIVIVFKLIEHIFKYYIVGGLWIRLATSSFLIDNPLNKLLL
jgi:hypothetical protein